MPIYFYTRSDPYYEFSNFSPHGFQLKGKYWKTVEHYFQAMKFEGTEHEETVRIAYTPKDAKTFGQRRDWPLRPDWETVKDGIMHEAVLAKFQTHQDLAQSLLGTGNEDLIENAPGDYYWGCGADGTGKNKLGKILMDVRDILRDEHSE